MIEISWLIQTTADVPEDDAWLSGAEASTLSRLRIPKRRADWRLGRWTAKRALSASLGLACEIRAAEDGAPEAFVAGAPAPCAISISHAGGLGVCAVAPPGTLVGCDLERVEARGGVLADDYFTPAERDVVRLAGDAERDLVETLVWSAKESALKALREGLRLDTRSVEVRLPDAPPSGDWRPFEVAYASAGTRFDGWWRREGGLVLTLAASPWNSPGPPRPL